MAGRVRRPATSCRPCVDLMPPAGGDPARSYLTERGEPGRRGAGPAYHHPRWSRELRGRGNIDVCCACSSMRPRTTPRVHCGGAGSPTTCARSGRRPSSCCSAGARRAGAAVGRAGAPVVTLDIARRGRWRGVLGALATTVAVVAADAHRCRCGPRRHRRRGRRRDPRHRVVRRRRGVVGAAQAAAPAGGRRLHRPPQPQPPGAGPGRDAPPRATHHPRRRRRRQRVRPGPGRPGRVPQPVAGGPRRPSGRGRRRRQPDGDRRRPGVPLRAHRRRRSRRGPGRRPIRTPCPTSCSRGRSCTRPTRTPPSGSPCTCCHRCAICSRRAGSCFAGECPDWMRSFGQLHGIEVTGPPRRHRRGARRSVASSSRRSAPGPAPSSR